ncbi:MAG: beta-lactamase [Chitinophagaceae bacterium]|nr:beta-lactamase [Chitinophagaceae bacterium]
MKKITILAVTLTIAHLSFSQPAGEKLDLLVTAYAKQYHFNGSVLVAKNGTILLNKGYGYRNAGEKVLNNEQTIFQLGSITKQFTSAIILKLQEEKKLSVQDKLSKYFPDYPKGDSISIEQLLLHISGIYSYTNDKNFMTSEVTKPANREKMMALFKDKPLDFSPGTGWNYSNSGYALLGYIIENVTKKPYEQAVHNYIFNPLQMTHSGFDFVHLKSKEKAKGYFKLNDKDTAAAPVVDSSVSYSAGAIYSTTGDLYKWHQALENYTILSKAQQDKAYTPVKNNYGYGWGIDSIEGKRRVGHGGGIHGFTTNIARVPEDDICIVLLSNASDGSLQDITKSIFAILYNKEYEVPKERIAIKVPEETLKQYEGEYEIRPELRVIISIKDGELLASPTGQSPDILYAEKEDFFFVKTEDIQVEFKRNEKKEIDRFILYQGGAKITCKKIARGD